MNQQSYLLFELGQARYGIPTAAVQELFLLPEISPLPEAPACVVGVINLRGEILPIVDLHRRLGQKVPAYQLNNSVIVLQEQNQRLGLIVTQVHGVETIAPEQIQPAYGRAGSDAQSWMTGLAHVDATLVILLQPTGLIQAAALAPQTEWNGDRQGNGWAAAATIASSEAVDLFAHLLPAARQILRERANSLRQAIETEDTTGVPIAVMGLQGEYFGLGLEAVYEFTDIRKITPVPCCPAHILGNMNLRGEIVTIVDISQTINLPIDTSPKAKAIVVRQDELTVGLAVDDIFDVVYLNPTQISAVPIAIRSTGDDYLQGVAAYRDKMMSIINLSKILTTGTLAVNEEV